MAVRYPGDGETEQIGKLVDAGHPRLAFAAICVRNLRRVAIAALFVSAAIYAPDAIDHVKASIHAIN